MTLLSNVFSARAASFNGNLVAEWAPADGTTAGQVLGWVLTSSGTVSHPAIATTNLQTQMRRTRFTSAASTNSTAGLRTDMPVCWRGNAAGLGGFAFSARFSLSTNMNGSRAFIGLSTQSASVVASEPSGIANTIGVGFDSGDSSSGQWYVIRKDATTNAKVAISAAPRNTSDVYDVSILCATNGSEIIVRLTNLTTGSSEQLVISSILPTSASLLHAHAEAGSGTTSTAVDLELAGLSLETADASRTTHVIGKDGVVNVQDFGLIADDQSAGARAANQAAVAAAIAAMGPAPSPDPPGFVSTTWLGAVLAFPRGIFYFEDTIHITRSLELRGHSASNGMYWADTVLCFPKGKAGLVVDYVTESASGGRGDGSKIRNIALCSGPWSAGNTTPAWARWEPSKPYVLGESVIPAQWSKWGYAFECTTAGTSGSSDSFFPGKKMNELLTDATSAAILGVGAMLQDLSVSAASNAVPIVITTQLPHGLANGARVRIDGVGGNTAANGPWVVTVTGTTTFELNGSTGNGTYTTGGKVSYSFLDGTGTLVWTLRHVHGIDVRAPCVHVENVFIRSFAGNGINTVSNLYLAGGGGANLTYAERLFIEMVGGHGICLHGNDVNVSSFKDCSITYVGGFGVMNDPGLSCHLYNIHVSGPEGGFSYWLDRCTGQDLYAEGGSGPIHVGALATVRDAIPADGYSDEYTAMWSAGAIAAGAVRRPTTHNGYKYVAQNSGTAVTEPTTWPTRAGSTVTQDGITWARCGIWGNIADANDPVWGWGNSGPSGKIHNRGQGGSRHERFTTVGHAGARMTVHLAPSSVPIPIRYDSTEDPNGCVLDWVWDYTLKSWYRVGNSANDIEWIGGPNASYFKPWLPSYPQGIGLGRAGIYGAAFPNPYPRLVSASRPPLNEGVWAKGDIVFNNDPSAASVFCWRCVSSGTSGTWEPVHYSGVKVETTFQSDAVWRDTSLTGTIALKVQSRSRRLQAQTTTATANQVIDAGGDSGTGEDFVLPASSMTRLVFLITMKKASTADGGTIEVKADYVRNGSGAPTLIGTSNPVGSGANSITYNLSGSSVDGTTVDLNVNGNRVELRASPESLDTLNWRIVRTQTEGVD